jgi:hypothetical protein
MSTRSWGLAIVMAALACAPQRDQSDSEPLQQGRMYTAWLYGNEYSKLWERFSPEMQQTFGSVADLASFASRAPSTARWTSEWRMPTPTGSTPVARPSTNRTTGC